MIIDFFSLSTFVFLILLYHSIQNAHGFISPDISDGEKKQYNADEREEVCNPECVNSFQFKEIYDDPYLVANENEHVHYTQSYL